MVGWFYLIQNFSVIPRMIWCAEATLEDNFMKRDFPVLHIKCADQMEHMTNSFFSCSTLDLFMTFGKIANFLFLNIWDTEHISGCSWHHSGRFQLHLSAWEIFYHWSKTNKMNQWTLKSFHSQFHLSSWVTIFHPISTVIHQDLAS